jgi:hypothetical protein
MNDNELNTAELTSISQALGQLSGELRVMHQSLTSSITIIRDDLRRAEDNANTRISRLEDSITNRLDGMGNRISALESEDNRLNEKVARLSALGGGIGGIISAAAIELLKRM